MIVTEYYKTRSDGVVLNRTYSDAGMMILQNETGVEYAEAIDVNDAPYTYTETEKKVNETVVGLQMNGGDELCRL